MNSASIIAILTCLLVLTAQAQPGIRTRRCKCAGEYIKKINSKLIKGEPVVHDPSNFCPRTEIIIITTTSASQKCVNPDSPLGKLILANKKKQKEREALRMTTSSGQTATSTHHTTSKL